MSTDSLTLAPAERDRNTATLNSAGREISTYFQTLVQADFSDIDLLCQAVRDWNLDFRPLSNTSETSRIARLVQARSDRVYYGYARCLLNLEQHGAPPPGCVTFGVLEKTVRRLWWRGQDIDNATVLVFPFGGELHSLSTSDFGVHTISVHITLAEEICMRMNLDAIPGFGPPETFVADAPTLHFLRSQLARIAVPSAVSESVAAEPIVEALVRSWATVVGSKHFQNHGTGHARTMRRALERLDAPDWLALTPADLCRYAEVGERTLQYAFRDRFGVTPAAFLKARRLAAVRVALKSSSPSSIVGDVAAEYGFWHPGQFAADYRGAYGELPSETLVRSQRGSSR